MKRLIAPVVLGLVVIGCLAALIVAWQSSLNDRPLLGALEEKQPMMSVAGEETRTERVSATVDLEWLPESELLSSGFSGTVTRVPIGSDAELTTGALVYEVDGKSLVLFVSDLPPYRSLEWGHHGEDVLVLRDFLVTLGFEAEVVGEDRFERSMRNAVRAFNEQMLGAKSSIFDPSSVVWSPSNFFVNDWVVAVGDAAPGRGEVVAISTPSVSAGTLNYQEARPPETSNGIVSVTSDRNFAFEMSAEDGNVPDPIREELGRLFDPTVSELAVEVASGAPVEVQTVPSLAVVTAPSGQTCVIIDTSSGVFEPHRVEIVGGRLGVTHLPIGSIAQDKEVLLNPHEILQTQTLTC